MEKQGGSMVGERWNDGFYVFKMKQEHAIRSEDNSSCHPIQLKSVRGTETNRFCFTLTL